MTENVQIPNLSWAAHLRANIHSVTFVGIYSTKDDLAHDGHAIKPYPDHRDTEVSPSHVTINPSTIKVINAVKQLDKKNISIVDFGGGNGKMYNALKQKTEKKFDYKIVELPEVHKNLNEEISYYSACGEINDKIDILYSDATLYLTEEDVYKNIKDFCAVKANKIILTRSILSTNSDIKSYFTFVPKLGLCFHIVDIEEFKKQFESYGYKLAEISYSSEDDMCFRNNSHPIDSPFISYYDTIFIKS